MKLMTRIAAALLLAAAFVPQALGDGLSNVGICSPVDNVNCDLAPLSSSQAQKEITANEMTAKVAGMLANRLSIASGDANMTLTPSQATNFATFEITGTLTADRNLVVPSTFLRLYDVANKTSGGFNIIVKAATGAAISVAAGTEQLVRFDGTNVVAISSSGGGGGGGSSLPRAAAVATAAVLPNSPTYSNGTAGIGATLTAGSNAALVVDGYSVALGDRVLVKNQASSFQNGLYVVSTVGSVSVPWVLTRSSDSNLASTLTGATVAVINGTANTVTGWLETATVATIGTDAVVYTEAALNPSTIASLNAPQTWNAGQRGAPTAVSLVSTTFTPDMNTGNNFTFQLVHGTCAPCQIANPTNLTAGQTGVLVIKQSATGGDTLLWGGDFSFPSGTPTLQTGGAAEDYFSYYVESSSKIVVGAGSGGASLVGVANGDILYNNAGVIAGFIMSGDATVNVATGVVTITGLSLSKLATIPADNIVGNFTGGTAAPGSGALVDCPSSGVGNALTYAVASHAFACNNVPGASLIGVQTFQTHGSFTYTPHTGTSSVMVYVVGAGGGSGGSAATSTGQAAASGGGGGGAAAIKYCAGGFSGVAVVVGTGGTAGASGNNAGGAGGNSTFVCNAVTLTGGGGGAGGGGTALSSNAAGFSGTGGTATNGDVNVPGGASSANITTPSLGTTSGSGGNSVFAAGAAPVQATGSAIAGTGCGAGASGSALAASQSAKTGAAGGDGCVIVYEYGANSATMALVGVQVLTSASGAFVPDAGTSSVVIDVVGGGGGGSGVPSPTGTSVEMGASGAAGGYVRKYLASGFAGATYAVGAGGTGGAAGANNGAAGGNSTFTTTGAVTYTAGGGGAGNFRCGPTAAPFNCGSQAGGTATGGDVNIAGEQGGFGNFTSTSIGAAGNGGNSPTGLGGNGGFIQAANSSSAGNNGSGYGSGGGGAAATGTGAAAAGGNGAAGVIIVYEYGGGAVATGNFVGVQRITATGAYTYTPSSSNVHSVVVELQGAGGGGGGVSQPTSTNIEIATGAGGGCWIRVRLTANFSGATGSVGAHGAGGTAGANDGVAGGNTTFVTTAGSPVTYTAGGGSAGVHWAAGGSPAMGGGVAGGTCTNGDDQVPGGASGTEFSISTALSQSGPGGISRYSPGAAPVIATANASTAGVTATGKGGGGSGAAAQGTGAAAAGGNGSDGEVIIWEYN